VLSVLTYSNISSDITFMLSQAWGVRDMVSAGVEVKINRLESIVEQIGEAVLATTETIERLAERVDTISVQVEEQGKQVQQQGYQILALCDAVQTLAESQDDTLQRLNHLTYTLDRLMTLIQGTPEG
jgi:methyl-accepting chemotaxis protein